jgi:hypothetical protein
MMMYGMRLPINSVIRSILADKGKLSKTQKKKRE